MLFQQIDGVNSVPVPLNVYYTLRSSYLFRDLQSIHLSAGGMKVPLLLNQLLNSGCLNVHILGKENGTGPSLSDLF